MKLFLLPLFLTIWSSTALAGLTEHQIRNVSLSPSEGARVPMALRFEDINGKETSLAQALGGRPTLLLPADFTCTQICGPALTIVASTLRQTGLVAGRDYSLVVFGIDAHDDLAAARQFVRGQVDGPGLSILTGGAAQINQLAAAIGYHFQPDASNGAIAHPAGFVTLTADGRVSHAFSSLGLQPFDLKLGLLEAGRGTIGGLSGRIALLCYGFDPLHGIYTRHIAAALKVASAFTVFCLVAAIAFMCRRSRPRGTAA